MRPSITEHSVSTANIAATRWPTSFWASRIFSPFFVITGPPSFSDPFKGTTFGAGIDPNDPVATYNPHTKQALFVKPVYTFASDPHLRNPYVQQYSLSVQRQLSGNFALELNYIGN